MMMPNKIRMQHVITQEGLGIMLKRQFSADLGIASGMAPRITHTLAAAFLVYCGGAISTAANATGQLDEAVLREICRNDPDVGADLEAQCAVFDLDAPNRTAAANGNNLGITGAQGRSSVDVRKRLDDLREDDGEGGMAADWTVGKLGIFITGEATFSDRDATANELANDSTDTAVTIGADWRFDDSLIAGIALTYGSGDTDFSGNAGKLDTDSYAATLYASVAPNDTYYFDGYVGLGRQDYDGRRNISFSAGGTPVNATANSDTDGDEWVAGVSAGADFAFEGWTIGPHAQLDYSRREIDAYSETGGSGFAMSYGDQTIRSLQSTLGGHASFAHSTDWGVVVPSARIEWVHEFKDDDRQIPASFTQSPGNSFVIQTDEADHDFFRVGVGVSAIMPHGWVAFSDFQTQFSHDFLDRHVFAIGLRKEF
jgi:outer membrane autotransporter protein